MEHESVYAYKRKYNNEELIVLNNFYGKHTTVKLHDVDGYELLISNYPAKKIEEVMELEPYESIVYIRNR